MLCASGLKRLPLNYIYVYSIASRKRLPVFLIHTQPKLWNKIAKSRSVSSKISVWKLIENLGIWIMEDVIQWICISIMLKKKVPQFSSIKLTSPIVCFHFSFWFLYNEVFTPHRLFIPKNASSWVLWVAKDFSFLMGL